MTPIRVLHLIGSSRCGGAENVVLAMSTGSDPDKLATEVGLLESGWLADQLLAHRVRTHMLRKCRTIDLTLLRDLRSVVGSVRPDVVHCHLSAMNLYGSFAAASLRIPAVVHVHGLSQDFEFARRRLVQRIVWACASRIVTVSEYLAREIRRRGAPSTKLVCIPNGVDLSRFRPRADVGVLRADMGLPKESALVGVVSRLEYRKGVDLAVEAFGAVRETRRDAYLVIAGEGTQRAELEARVRALGLSDSVRFLGHVDHVSSVFGAADVVLVPSRTEGFSLSAAEAMAAGCPVIAWDHQGPREVVADGVAGRLVPPFDIPGMASATLDLISRPSLRRAMGESGRAHVRQHYSRDRMNDAWLSLYTYLVDRSRMVA